MLVINNGYPGPTIEANWGDWIEVSVHNTLDEGTALHWHGLLQQNTVLHLDTLLIVVLHGRRSRRSAMSDCAWRKFHLSLSSGPLRNILVPFSLQFAICLRCRWRNDYSWS